MRDNKKYQTMVFTVEKYHWQNTVEEARAEMWKDIAKFLELLTKNEYISVIYDDDIDIIVIQYEHNEKIDPWGCANPVWLEEDEYYLKADLEEDGAEIVYKDDELLD